MRTVKTVAAQNCKMDFIDKVSLLIMVELNLGFVTHFMYIFTEIPSSKSR